MGEKTFYVVLSALIVIVPSVVYHHFKEFKRNKLIKKIYNKVQWCLDKSEINYINRLFTDDCEEYSIKSDEHNIISEILHNFSQDLNSMYFKNILSTNKEFLDLCNDDYLVFALYCFLSKHECDIFFNEHKMYEEISKTNYGSYGRQLCTAEYNMTSYGVVFNKFLYHCCNYCKQKNIRTTHNLFALKNSIEKKTTTISRL